MSVPHALFIDTSILDQQNYNFSSAEVTLFIAAAKEMHLTYLLPDPTSREINRHIGSRADEVVRALEDARRRAPFLAKSKLWPSPGGFAQSWELRQLAMDEWKEFLTTFNVLHLSLDGINLTEVMAWYDKQEAPFGPKKKKEFPDALALASLLTFARKEDATVAVVSRDHDFQGACERFAELLYFPSLPAFTEALLASDQRVTKVKSILNSDNSVIEAAIREEFCFLKFYPQADPHGEVEEVEVSTVEFSDLHVVGVGNGECTIAFEASVSFTAHVQYDDPGSAVVDTADDVYIPIFRYCGFVDDDAVVTGVAKVEILGEWAEFGAVRYFNIAESEIEVWGRPERQSID